MLNKGKSINIYDFSGGINVSQPPYLIADNECFCNPYNLEGTVNMFWDVGFKKRKGTLKANSAELTGSMKKGVRFYRSVAPQRTTFVFVDTGSEVKIYYLDDTGTFQELSGGSLIPTDSEIFYTTWKDKLYVASGNQLVQVVSHTGSAWTRSDLSGLTHKPGRIYLHRDRLWVAGGDMPEGYLECCDYEDDTDWSGGDGFAFNVGFKDGDPVCNLISLGNKLIIYKNDSLWSMQGDNLQNWFQDKEEKSVGCVAPDSIIDVGMGHIFLGADNIYFFDGDQIAPIGNKIKPFLDLIPEGRRSLATASYYDNCYRISIPSYNDTVTNTVELLLDLKNFKTGNVAWWLNSGRSINCYINYNGADDTNDLYFCDGEEGYLQQSEIGSNDNGTLIVGECQTKYLVFGEPNRDKIFDRLFLDIGRGVGTYNIEIYRNIENEYILPVAINSLSGVTTFGNAVLGSSMLRASGSSRLKTEIPLPSECDGKSISVKVRHDEDYADVSFYGLSLVYGYKAV